MARRVLEARVVSSIQVAQREITAGALDGLQFRVEQDDLLTFIGDVVDRHEDA